MHSRVWSCARTQSLILHPVRNSCETTVRSMFCKMLKQDVSPHVQESRALWARHEYKQFQTYFLILVKNPRAPSQHPQGGLGIWRVGLWRRFLRGYWATGVVEKLFIWGLAKLASTRIYAFVHVASCVDLRQWDPKCMLDNINPCFQLEHC